MSLICNNEYRGTAVASRPRTDPYLTNCVIQRLPESGAKARVSIGKGYDVGLHVLLTVRAVSRTPSSPLDLRFGRLLVRGNSALRPLAPGFVPPCALCRL